MHRLLSVGIQLKCCGHGALSRVGRGDKDTFSFSSDCHPLSQLFGFVFACYVSKVFLEEEDSCKCIPPPPHSRPRDVGAAGLCSAVDRPNPSLQ